MRLKTGHHRQGHQFVTIHSETHNEAQFENRTKQEEKKITGYIGWWGRKYQYGYLCRLWIKVSPKGNGSMLWLREEGAVGWIP